MYNKIYVFVLLMSFIHNQFNRIHQSQNRIECQHIFPQRAENKIEIGGNNYHRKENTTFFYSVQIPLIPQSSNKSQSVDEEHDSYIIFIRGGLNAYTIFSSIK